MDPNACLAIIAACLNPQTRPEEWSYELAQALLDLYHWIDNNGFEPDWNDHPDATKCYRDYVRFMNTYTNPGIIL